MLNQNLNLAKYGSGAPSLSPTSLGLPNSKVDSNSQDLKQDIGCR